MKLETFFDKFELFAGTPDAVAKMRRLILQMAVRGRLVDQRRNEENATNLLARILHLSRSTFDYVAYQPTDVPLSALPKSWCWAPTAILCDLQTGKRMKGGAQGTGVVSLGGEHLKADGTVDFTVPRYVSREFYDEMSNGKVALHDTLMVKDGATTGKTAFIAALPEDGLAGVNEHVFILRWHTGIEKKLGFYFMRAFAASHIAIKSAGLIGGIKRGAVLDFAFPLPPLCEQRRIVAKVDELMSLCDRLEAQQHERETRYAALARASLARFAEEPTPGNLEFLFHDAYAIPAADLRKSILALAIQGKLVTHDPRDEPVERLLARALFERRGLNRTRDDHVRVLTDEDTLGFDIPASWRWQWLDDLLVFGPANGFSPKAVGYETPVRSLTLSATTSGRFNGEHAKFIAEDVPEESDLWLRDGDILVQRGNSVEYVGVAAVYRGDKNQFIYPDLMMKLRVSAEFDVKYVHMAMSHEAAREFLRARATGTSGSMPKINQATLKRLPIPIPPLAEQRRIVAKVDELMKLVDKLEAELAHARATATDLLTAAVTEMTRGRAG